MSKKGYVDYAVIEYRIEKITDAKIRLKNEANKEHCSGRNLLIKKIIKKSVEVDNLWNKLHVERRIAKRKGTWNDNYERVINNIN